MPCSSLAVARRKGIPLGNERRTPWQPGEALGRHSPVRQGSGDAARNGPQGTDAGRRLMREQSTFPLRLRDINLQSLKTRSGPCRSRFFVRLSCSQDKECYPPARERRYPIWGLFVVRRSKDLQKPISQPKGVSTMKVKFIALTAVAAFTSSIATAMSLSL